MLAAELSVSFVLAAIGGLSVLSSYSTISGWTNFMTFSAYIVGPAWLILAIVILCTQRKRGLWVLLGAPFALYCTGLVVALVWSCATGRGCV